MTNLPYACTNLDRTFNAFALVEALNKIDTLEEEVEQLRDKLTEAIGLIQSFDLSFQDKDWRAEFLEKLKDVK